MKERHLLLILYSLLLIIVISFSIIIFSMLKDENIEEIEEPTIPVIEEPVYLQQFDPNKFVFVEDYLYYNDYRYTSKVGIDISEFNGEIDFLEVKRSGIEFVIMRIGRRGYSSGNIHPDAYFNKYFAQAKDAGLDIGVYFFSQAINEEEAKEEAEYVLDILDGQELALGISLDFELLDIEDARGDHISKEQATKNANVFFETIGSKYDCYLYTSTRAIMRFHDHSLIDNYPLWYAQYYLRPECPYDISIWQYSEQGQVSGINVPVDMNILFIKKTNQ